jgi:hypothetical protein
MASSERSGIQIIKAASGTLMAAKIKSKAHSGMSLSMLLPAFAPTRAASCGVWARGARLRHHHHMRKAEAAA